MRTLVRYSISNTPPRPQELPIGQLALQISGSKAYLYTKNEFGEIIQIGQGAERFEDLLDVDLTGVRDGSYLIYQNGKYRASNQIGSLSSLSDVEISNPRSGEYLRYDPISETFHNYRPSYSLFELLDVSVANPTNPTATADQNDQVLVFNAVLNRFETRSRRNTLQELDDVEISDQERYQVVMLDPDGIWRNQDLQIERDPSPKLGTNLNAQGHSLIDSTYRVKRVELTTAIVELNYAEADYWILQGVPASVLPYCTVVPIVTNHKVNSSAIMMLELRQDTGAIVLAGLENMQYEDGRPIKLSGPGRVDLVTVHVSKRSFPTFANPNNTRIDSYITVNALNLAPLGQGGIPAYRYDKSRLAEPQSFSQPDLYDPYYDYVALLHTFEPEQSTGRLWSDDKSQYYLPGPVADLVTSTTTTNTAQLETDLYTFGIQEKVASFTQPSHLIETLLDASIQLTQDFTIEFFVEFPLPELTLTPQNDYTLFQLSKGGSPPAIDLQYKGLVAASTQTTELAVTIGSLSLTLPNAYTYFQRGVGLYQHVAIVRQSTQYRVFIDGVTQNYRQLTSAIAPNGIEFDRYLSSLVGNLNSVRITDRVARYWDNFLPPDMRFGLTGGEGDRILESQVFSYGFNLGEHSLGIEWFY
ncbi:hypothetical protein [Chroococcidiopsis sp.]|uniref:hypothetical protein n=1 Tax=Chroococcidiopsis sp. TaxID=3088168 RepID=UPI003F411657